MFSYELSREVDIEGMCRLYYEAFPDGSECGLVRELYDGHKIVLSLSCVDDLGNVIGNIVYSNVDLLGFPYIKVAGLGPVAVKEGYRKKGIGSNLINKSLSILENELEYHGVVVLGYKSFYSRFGFENGIENYGIKYEDFSGSEVDYSDYFMVLKFHIDFLKARYTNAIFSEPFRNINPRKGNVLVLPRSANGDLGLLNTDILSKLLNQNIKSFFVNWQELVLGRQSTICRLTCCTEVGDAVQVIIKRVYSDELPPKNTQNKNVMFKNSVINEIDVYRIPGEVQRLSMPSIYHSEMYIQEDKLDSIIVMEDLCSLGYKLRDGLNMTESKIVLEHLARLHAFYWKTYLPYEFRGSYWSLEKRDAVELETGLDTWKEFLFNFPDLANFPEATSIGFKLKDKAEFINDELTKTLFSRIHGDVKCPNLFFRNSELVIIDYQWYGIGNPLSDVASFIATSVLSPTIEKETELLDFYIEKFVEESQAITVNEFKSFVSEYYSLCFLDYARVVIFGLWRGLKVFESRPGSSLIMQNPKNAMYLLERTSAFLECI